MGQIATSGSTLTLTASTIVRRAQEAVRTLTLTPGLQLVGLGRSAPTPGPATGPAGCKAEQAVALKPA